VLHHGRHQIGLPVPIAIAGEKQLMNALEIDGAFKNLRAAAHDEYQRGRPTSGCRNEIEQCHDSSHETSPATSSMS